MKELIGRPVFVRTVSYYYLGLLVEVTPSELVLTHCSWVAETQRWADTLASGRLREVEPYPAEDRVYVSRGGVADVVGWRHALPTQAIP